MTQTLQVSLPDLDAVPIFAPIPILIHIVTTSKPLGRDDMRQIDNIFPEPPSTPRGVELRLMRRVGVCANGPKEWGTEKMSYLGGMGPKSNIAEHTLHGLVVRPKSKAWIPEGGDKKKQKGKWKQEVSFQSTFTLTCPPSFDTDTMSVEVRTFGIRFF